MQVTDVVFNPVTTGDNILGMASVTLDGSLVIKGIRVIQGKFGPFIGFPSQKKKDAPAGAQGKDAYMEIVHPLSKIFRDHIQDAILTKAGLTNLQQQNQQPVPRQQQGWQQEPPQQYPPQQQQWGGQQEWGGQPTAAAGEDDVPF